MEGGISTKNKSIKHWLIVLYMCCLIAVSIGLCNNALGVFFTPVSKSLGVMQGTFAMHATLTSLACAFTGLVMPSLMKKYKYKILLVIGLLLSSLSSLGMAFSHHVYLFYILGILRGIGIGVFGIVPVTIFINNWFSEKNGLATSIALSFSGVAGAIFSPLLSMIIEKYGWQTAYIMSAIIIVLLVLPTIILPWTIDPKDSGLLSYGLKNEVKNHTEIIEENFNFKNIGFICMAVLAVLLTIVTGLGQHMAGISTSIQLSASVGATMISLAMIGNILSKLVIGILSDWLSPLKAVICMWSINIISLVCLIFGMQASSSILMYLASFFFGSIYSVCAVGLALLTRQFFSSENFTQVYSKIGFLTNVGGAFSLSLMGYVYDFAGNYFVVIMMCLVMHLVSLLLFVVIVRRNKIVLKR